MTWADRGGHFNRMPISGFYARRVREVKVGESVGEHLKGRRYKEKATVFFLSSPYENPSRCENKSRLLSLFFTSSRNTVTSSTSDIRMLTCHRWPDPRRRGLYTLRVHVIVKYFHQQCPLNLYSSTQTTPTRFKPRISGYFLPSSLQSRPILALKIKRQTRLEYVKGYSRQESCERRLSGTERCLIHVMSWR